SLQSDASATRLELEIDEKAVDSALTGGVGDYVPYDLSSSLPSRGQKYDIVDGKVIALGGGFGGAVAAPTQPPVLAARENATVVYAAMNHPATTAVFVRRAPDGRRSVVVARDGAGVRTL